MATLTGKKISESYKDLLQVSNSNAGVDGTLRDIEDGEGTSSVLQISSSSINIKNDGALQINETAITATASELNILDGVTSTASELNILDGVTATTAELNYVDGVTSNIQTQLDSKVSATLTQEQVEDFVGGMLDGTETGISVSYDDTDGNIDFVVASQTDENFTTADHSKLDGIEASADVTDATNVTAAGALMDSELASIADVKALDQSVISGATPTFTTTNFTDASNKRLMTDAQETKLDSVESNATADQTDEEIQDVVGAMFSSNTETGITATYQDGDGTIDLVVGTLNQDTTGTAAKVTVSDSTANTNFPVVFHDESNALLDDTGALRYNPSTGELLVPKLTVAGTTTTVDTVTMNAANAVKFEGATAAANETILSIVDPTNDDNTQYLLNASGYIPLLAAATTTTISSTPAELNVLDGYTGSVTELNYLDTLHATGVTDTEFDYLDGVTSNIQTQLDATLDTAGTGIDISSTTISVDVSDFMSNGASGRVLRATGADAMSASTNVTIDGNHLELIDSGVMKLGNSGDLQLFHNATNSFIENYTGALFLDNKTSDQDIYFKVNDGGSTLTALRIDASEIGRVKLPNDGQRLVFGASDDLHLEHAGTDSYISNQTGDFYIQNQADDKDIIFRADDGSGGNTPYLTLDGSSGYTKAHKHILYEDSVKAMFGTGGDLAIQHDGSNSYISHNVTGDLYIENTTSDEDIFIRVNDGGSTITAMKIDASEVARVQFQNDNQVVAIGASDDLQLYHQSDHNYILTQKADADLFIRHNTSGGYINAIQIDGSDAGTAIFNHDVKVNDNGKLKAGSGNDFQMMHDGTNSYFINSTGHLYIQNQGDDKDIVLQSDDGSGSVTAYLTLDGSATTINVAKNMMFADDVKAYFGNSSDAYIYYEPTNDELYIRNANGDTKIRNEATDADIIFSNDDGSGGDTNYMVLDGGEKRTYFYEQVRVVDSKQFAIGSGDDLELKHDGSNSTILNHTGNLTISQRADDADIILESDDGSGGNTAYLTLDGSLGALSIQKDMYRNDGVNLYMGSHSDQYMYYDGTNDIGYWRATTGDIIIRNDADDKDIILQSDDGSGGTTAYLTLDGSITTTTFNQNARVVDSKKMSVGNADDASFYHDGTDTYFENGTGNFYIRNLVDDGDLIFQGDNGSGGNATYLTLDGSATKVQIDKNMVFSDNVQAQFGGNVDIKIYHNSSSGNANIENYTGSLYVTNYTDDGDIFFRVDDGGSNIITALEIDASAVGRVKLPNDLQYLTFGAGGDGVLYSYQDNFYVSNHTAGKDTIFTNLNSDSSSHVEMMRLDGSAESIEIAKKMQFPASHSADKIVMYSGGNEKIGTEANTLLFTADNHKFKDTAGHTNVTFDNAGNISATADVIAYASSDKRLKDNLKPIENSLDKVSKLSGYEFDWNDKQEIYQGHDVGVIAQEVEEILPEVVTTRDSGYKAVKYEKLVPLLIESIKELKEEINGLKTKLGEYDG